MGLSLKELKGQLVEKQGYTISPKHSQLADLKALIDDMIAVRSESPPSTGSGSYSGTNCIGHQVVTDYNMSLGDISNLGIKGCACHTVNDTTAYCGSRTHTCNCNSNTPTCNCNLRTGSCNCNSNTPTCNCNLRTGSCNCNSNTPTCNCNSRSSSSCDCQSRTGGSDCDNHIQGKLQQSSCSVVWSVCNVKNGQHCSCLNRTHGNSWDEMCMCYDRVGGTTCECNGRTSSSCICQTRTSSCGTVSPSECTCVSRTSSCGTVSTNECTCVSRTSSCGSRNTTSCQCNGRCACNSEKRFE